VLLPDQLLDERVDELAHLRRLLGRVDQSPVVVDRKEVVAQLLLRDLV
jgi:hypothetical protein